MPEEPTTPALAVLARRLGEAWNARDVSAIMSSYASDAVEKQTNYTDIDEARAAAEPLAKERG